MFLIFIYSKTKKKQNKKQSNISFFYQKKFSTHFRQHLFAIAMKLCVEKNEFVFIIIYFLMLGLLQCIFLCLCNTYTNQNLNNWNFILYILKNI